MTAPSVTPAGLAAQRVRAGYLSAEHREQLARLVEEIDECLADEVPVPEDIKDVFSNAVTALIGVHPSSGRPA